MMNVRSLFKHHLLVDLLRLRYIARFYIRSNSLQPSDHLSSIHSSTIHHLTILAQFIICPFFQNSSFIYILHIYFFSSSPHPSLTLPSIHSFFHSPSHTSLSIFPPHQSTHSSVFTFVHQFIPKPSIYLSTRLFIHPFTIHQSTNFPSNKSPSIIPPIISHDHFSSFHHPSIPSFTHPLFTIHQSLHLLILFSPSILPPICSLSFHFRIHTFNHFSFKPFT